MNKKIVSSILFKTYREYWDHSNQDIPPTKEEEDDPHKLYVTYDDGTSEYLDN